MSAPRLSAATPPAGFVTVESWRDLPACNNHPRLPATTWDDQADGDSGRRGRNRTDRIKAAIAVCDTECPVRGACAADVDLRFDEGVRGGADLRPLRHADGDPA